MEYIGVVHMVRSNKYQFLETAQTAWMYKDNLDIQACDKPVSEFEKLQMERIKDITSFKYSYLIDCLDCKTFLLGSLTMYSLISKVL